MSAPNSTLQFAPLRTLDDFVLESARFQVPSSDLQKWNNRIVKNLLYYQTNYMLLMGLFNIIMGTIHPSKIILGISIIMISVILIKYVLNNDEILSGNALSRQKSTIICVIVGFMILYFAGAIFVVALALFLPLTCIFLHASLRLRNIRNKVTNAIEVLGIRNTPMGILLDALDVPLEIL